MKIFMIIWLCLSAGFLLRWCYRVVFERMNKREWLIIGALFLTLGFSSCIPSAQPDPVVIERHCEFVQLEPKPSLPTITWLDCGGMRCLDEIGYQSLKQRDAMLRTYADYLITVYDDARLRCSE